MFVHRYYIHNTIHIIAAYKHLYNKALCSYTRCPNKNGNWYICIFVYLHICVSYSKRLDQSVSKIPRTTPGTSDSILYFIKSTFALQNVDNGGVAITSFVKSTPARVLLENLSFFSNEAQAELSEKLTNLKVYVIVNKNLYLKTYLGIWVGNWVNRRNSVT